MSMCEVAERLEKMGIDKGVEQATLQAIANMLKYGVPEEKLLEDYTEEEISKAKKLWEQKN